MKCRQSQRQTNPGERRWADARFLIGGSRHVINKQINQKARHQSPLQQAPHVVLDRPRHLRPPDPPSGHPALPARVLRVPLRPLSGVLRGADAAGNVHCAGSVQHSRHNGARAGICQRFFSTEQGLASVLISAAST